MAKGKAKGKKDAAPAEVAPKEDKKGKKGKKGDGKAEGKRGSKRKSSKAVEVPIPEPEPEPEPPPPPPKPKCKDQMPTESECRYTPEACCTEMVLCRPNRYPGFLSDPQTMAVVGSECGSYASLCKLMRAGFRCADRVFTMTPWGNYVVFRSHNGENKIYFLFDGCTCNVNRFRYLDLSMGTAGLLYFEDVHEMICYIMESREMRSHFKSIRKSIIDDICREFCEFGGRHSTKS